MRKPRIIDILNLMIIAALVVVCGTVVGFFVYYSQLPLP